MSTCRHHRIGIHATPPFCDDCGNVPIENWHRVTISRDDLYLAFAKALNVEDAWGWTTGKDIADTLFGKLSR
jgi:hypothetical protein